MEKLLTGLIFLFLTCPGFAQTRLYVMQVSGSVIRDHRITLQKGDAIGKNDKIKLMPGAVITCIDDDGNTYSTSKTGTLSYENLLRAKKQYRNALTLEYLKYLWASFINPTDTRIIAAGVFRGDQLMLSPADSAQVLFSDVVLRWRSDPGHKDYHIFIRKSEDEEVRFTTQDTTLNLNGKLPLSENTAYEWAVSTRAYPALKNIPFFSFYTLDKTAFNAREKQYRVFIKDMKKMGMSRDEIEETLCVKFKICS